MTVSVIWNLLINVCCWSAEDGIKVEENNLKEVESAEAETEVKSAPPEAAVEVRG